MSKTKLSNRTKPKVPPLEGFREASNHVDNPFQSPAILSLCPGFCGLERGLTRAIGPIRVAAYVEIEAFIIANLIEGMQAGMVDAAPVYTDIKTFEPAPFRGKIHGIIGGYPCQPFSSAGKRKGTEDPRHLWPYIERIIAAIRPVWCYFENVDDHLTLGYPLVKESLQRLGYAVEEGIYTAQEAGAPHKRERLFILAISHRAMAYATQQRNIGHDLQDKTGEQGNTESGDSSSMADTDNATGRHLRNGKSGNEIIGSSETGLADTKCNSGNERFELESNGRQGETEQTGLGDKDMDHSISGRQQPIDTIQTGGHGTQPAGEAMAHANGAGCTDEGRHDQPDETKNEGIADGSAVLANGEGIGIQGLRTTGKQEPAISAGQEILGCNGEGVWPAGQGNYQHEWEEKRTIESGMGSTINGYNFREDLLRAFGNSVVEQTAEIAFIDLIRKHFQ